MEQKIIQQFSHFLQRSPKILNFCEMDYSSNQAYSEQHYDIISNIHYYQLKPSYLHEAVENLSQTADIGLFHFKNFKSYFNDPFLKKFYRYRETFITKTNKVLVFCSNLYWYANGHIDRFEIPENQTREWVGKMDGSRRYYFNADYILKYYQLTEKIGQKIHRELNREIAFLSNEQVSQKLAPKLLAYHLHAYEGWILRKKVPGMAISEMIKMGMAYDPVAIVEALLQQAIILEEYGYYHTDLHPRNILMVENKYPKFIDYGAIEQHRHFIKGYLYFLMCSYEIFHRKIIALRRFAPIFLLDSNLHPIYTKWTRLLLACPPSQWNFPKLLSLFREAQQETTPSPSLQIFSKWLDNVHTLICHQKIRLRRFEDDMVYQLNLQFQRKPWLKRVWKALRFTTTYLYDTITLKIKSLYTKKVNNIITSYPNPLDHDN
ncbi:MAG: hypothetical protein QM752_06110 [Gammaproteobacteria bacterium]